MLSFFKESVFQEGLVAAAVGLALLTTLILNSISPARPQLQTWAPRARLSQSMCLELDGR